MAHYGLLEKEKLESPLKPRHCPRCKTLNSRVEADWRKLEEKIDRVLEFIEAQGITTIDDMES